jgi:hypothetical protein
MVRKVPRNWYLLRNLSGDFVSFFDEPFEEYETYGDTFYLQLELMNPLTVFSSEHSFFVNPSLENLIRTGYMPGIAYSGYLGVSYVTGEAVPGFLTRQLVRVDNLQTAVRAGARTGVAVARRSPMIAAVLGIYAASSLYWNHIQELDWVPDLYQV